MADVSRDLFLSDLASNCSTSGYIPEVTTGLSLTDTSATIGEIPRIKGETSINRCHSVDPILLTLPSPSVRDDTLYDLSNDFPGVNEVLHNMSSVLNIPAKRSNNLHCTSHRTLMKTQTTPMTTPTTEPVVAIKHDSTIHPPLLKQPEQQAPSASKHSPLLMPIVQHDTPTLINFVSKAPPTQPSEPIVSLPHIPIRQFVPQLIHPSQLEHHNEQGLPSVTNAPPALLTVNDPLLKMKGNLKLLTFPQQPVHLAQYKPPAVLPVTMDTSSQTIIIPPAPPHNPVPPIEHSQTGKEYCKKRILELKRKATPTVSKNHIPLNTPTLSSLSNELDSHSGSPHLLKSSDDLTLLESPTSTSSRIDTPTPSDTTPTSPNSSPNFTSVAIQVTPGIDIGVQVGIEEDESSKMIDEQKPNNIALPNEEVPVIPQYNNQYIMVNDVIDDDETPSEGSSDDEFKMIGSEVDEECVISDEVLQTQIPYPTPTEYCESIEDHEENDDVLKKFGHLEKQLQLIEDKASAMKEDFQHSRKVLHSIDRISNDSYNVCDISETCEDGVRVANNSLSNNISSCTSNNRKNQFVGGDVEPLISHEDVPVVTDNIKEETLKQWMIKKRKERTTEYKKERTKRIALERIPFTPTKQPDKKMINSSDQPFPESKNSDRTRPTHLSDRSKRLSDAETLLSDLLTSSPVAHDRLPLTRSALSNAMKSMTLSCTIPRDSSSHVILGKSHVTSMDNTKTGIVHHGQMKVKKRQLSSIECLSEAEQMKMTEILQKTSEDRIERESNTSLQSSIDWSQIDQLINTN